MTIIDQRELPDHLVIFDGVCNLCEFSVNFIYSNDKHARFSFTPAQSPLGRQLLETFGIDASSLDTVVLVKNGKALTKSTAALEISRELDAPWPFMTAFYLVPEPVRDRIYDIIAANRYDWFGKKEQCMLPDRELAARFLEHPQQLPATSSTPTD